MRNVSYVDTTSFGPIRRISTQHRLNRLALRVFYFHGELSTDNALIPPDGIRTRVLIANAVDRGFRVRPGDHLTFVPLDQPADLTKRASVTQATETGKLARYATCERCGRYPGIADVVGAQSGLPPNWADDGGKPTPVAQATTGAQPQPIAASESGPADAQ